MLLSLTLSIYTPSNYILPSRMEKYAALNHEGKNSLTQVGREQGIRRLMSINLLKRLESSVHSFLLTIKRIQDQICSTLDTIAHYDPNLTLELNDLTSTVDFDADDQESDLFSVGKKVKIALEDMDYVTWKQDLEEDFNTLYVLVNTVSKITPEHDSKLQILLDTIAQKIENPLNPGNKKLIIFTAFSDTAEYLYDNVSRFAQSEFGLNTALVTGSVDGRTTVPKFKADLIIEHITYNKLDTAYDTGIFTSANLRGKLGMNAMEANRSLYSHIIYDSDNEKRFASELDINDKVAVYTKLPSSFFISTPVGKYNPDWAIAFNEGSVKHIYFIAETKGNTDSLELRGVELAKIECAKAHFAAISNESVTYDVVDSFEKLMNLVS